MAGSSILLLCASLLSLAVASDWKVPFGNNEHVQVVPLGRNTRTTNLTPNLVLPDDDPFYQAPPGIESAKPGAVLRTRRVPNAITFDNKKALNIKDAWQILYRSQDSQGHPEANVVTVLVPYKPKKDNHFSMAYFTVRTLPCLNTLILTSTGFGLEQASSTHAARHSFNTIRCNPSVILQLGAPTDATTPMFQTTLAVVAMSQGWIVSVPDSTGPKAAYACGPQMAYSTLDGLRAVRATGNMTGLGPNPVTTMYGYSGGASIVSWVTEFQPTYAPDVKIDGVALGGIIPSLWKALSKFPGIGNMYSTDKVQGPEIRAKGQSSFCQRCWASARTIPWRRSGWRRTWYRSGRRSSRKG